MSSVRWWLVFGAALFFFTRPVVAGAAHSTASAVRPAANAVRPAANAIHPAANAIHPNVISGSASPNATIVLTNQPVSFTVAISNTSGPAPDSMLSFGDSNDIVLSAPYPQFVSHTYTAAGTYTVVLTAVGVPGPIAEFDITVIDPAAFGLNAAPSSVIAGQAVNFTATTGAPVMGAFVDFGDGTSAPTPAGVTHLVHRYSAPSLYTARLLIAGQGNSFAQTQIAVTFNPVNVPIGQVYSSFMVGSPVMAGQNTSINLNFRIITPFVIGPSGVSPLQAIVELADMQGRVVQRSDPFALPFTQQNVNSIQSIMIPYTVPAEAGGNYLVRVYILSATGGTVARALSQPIVIIGGPDPAPMVSNTFHASGAVLTNSGPTRGGYNVNLGITTALQWSYEELLATGTFDPVSKRIDPLMTFQSATPAPVTAPAATTAPNASTTNVDSGHVTPPPQNSGTPSLETTAAASPKVSAPPQTPEPISSPKQQGTPAPSPSAKQLSQAGEPANAADASPPPQATPAPSAPQSQPAPAAAPPPQAPPPPPPPTPPPAPSLQFKDVVGRTDASLPAVIGSKETIRGLDATYSLLSGWTFQGGAGYFQLPSQSTTERTGGLLDVTRTWKGGNEALRVAYSNNEDNINKFVQTGTSGPLAVSAEVFEYTDAITPHLRVLLTGGASTTRQEDASGPNQLDTVDRADLNYNVGSTTLDVEYHNAGPAFGTLSGASALSDRAGGTAGLALSLSPISTFQFNYGHDYLRSVQSATSTAVAAFNITPPRWPGVALTLERDGALAPGSDTTTKTVNLGITKSGISSISFTGTLAALSDALAPENYSTTRTGTINYQYANGPHNFGLGFNATDATSVSSTSTVTESINYGFTFGGRTPPNATGVPMSAATRNFEFKAALSNANSRALNSGAYTATLVGLLSWHITPQLAPGIEGNYVRVYNIVPALDSHTSFLRFRLDVNY